MMTIENRMPLSSFARPAARAYPEFPRSEAGRAIPPTYGFTAPQEKR